MKIRYSVTSNSEGLYYLGLNKEYILEEKAFNHIVNGEFELRSTDKNLPSKIPYLRGGLHSYNGWINFKNKRKDIVHGRFYDPNVHQDWYFARELQNGVILLKLPRNLFTKQAASKTEYPDKYYKSGYLWKTLFPRKMSKKKIISVINEALYKLNKEESSEKILIGYALTSFPFKAIKIRIQLIGNKIISAFPIWEQPMTGNNGKPYSHLDTIGFILSASTIFFDDKKYLYKLPNGIFPRTISIPLMKKVTPNFILKRPKFSAENNKFENLKERQKHLKTIAETIGKDELFELMNYAKDWNVSKDTFYFMSQLYNELYGNIRQDIELKNSLSLYQNIHEILYIFSEYDKKNKTNFSLEYIEYFLKKKFIHTGGIDLWETKRLHCLIMNIVNNHHQCDAIEKYIRFLSLSPCRIAAYIDFDLNPFFNDNPCIISLPNFDIPLRQKHFYKFFAQSLSLNYTLLWNSNQLKNFCRKIICHYGKATPELLKDCLSFSMGTDLLAFGTQFTMLLNNILNDNKSLPDKKTIKRIRYDYYRCKIYQRHRILIENKKYLCKEIDYSDLESKLFMRQIKAKHELQLVKIITDNFLNTIAKFFNRISENDLENETMQMKDNFLLEKIPLPKYIPDYIESWITNKKHQTTSKAILEDCI